MKWIKKLQEKRLLYIFVISLFLLVLFPLIFRLGMPTVYRIIYLFIVGGLLSVHVGVFMRKNGVKGIASFILPLTYVAGLLILTLVNFSVWSRTFSFYFALYFWVLTLFGMQGISDDIDDKTIDKQIPVDGGIKDLD